MDQALVTYFQRPNSYTGEDVIEISCHGSPVILRQLLDATLYLGARMAEPGEFTLRAMAHGKINLSQAEAIRDLIEARSLEAANQAIRQLSGELSTAIAPVKNRILQMIVLLESSLEFAEDDLPPLQRDSIADGIIQSSRAIRKIAETYSAGHLLAEGLKVAIAGRPNVGKSSLFNSLVGADRAIVTEIPGTTRDSISEQITIGQIPVLLIDTAGMREASDPVETMGIERTHRAMADADLVLVVCDGTDEIGADDLDLLSSLESRRHQIVINKCDSPDYINPFLRQTKTLADFIEVSALEGTGLEQLRAAILEPFNGSKIESADLLVTNARHYDLLRRAEVELNSSQEIAGDASEELILVGLHNALKCLGEITGETTAEDVLTRIFATFCIGK
jgi:tRNA modification GTPase